MNARRWITIAGSCLAILVAASRLPAEEAKLDLAGTWHVVLDPSKEGEAKEFFKKELPGQIKLPGSIDDAKLAPANTAAPTLEGPYRTHPYVGAAWYQRDVEIPAGWQGKRVTLFLERCRWVTTVWLDDKRIGSQDSLIAPHVYDFGTAVTPGKHRLTISIDNTVKINLGKFVSALFGGTWGNMNGVVGRIELAATPPVWIDDVNVYPNVAKKTARVKVRIGNATGKPGSGTLSVGNQSVAAAWDAQGGQAEIDADMSGAQLWDEFTPNLTELTVKLGDDQRTVQFGMREFAAKGTQFTMNGRPVYLRGTLECSIWPLTGYPPMDVPSWQRIYKVMKSYGLNHIRFHSWCPPDAAFAAADVEGIMIQAEGPQANVPAGQDPARDKFIEAEFLRIVHTYGNHPSFCTMTLGNEYGGKPELLARWVEMLVKADPRHLYSSASSAQTTPNRQWTETPGGRGIHGEGTDRDLAKVVAGDGRPIIGHEIGQWTYWPDSNEIKKWTGVMALRNYEMVRDDLKRKSLFDLEPQFVQACGKFATLLYKEEIEVLLRTPGYAGFSLLDLHDYPTQGTALIGPLDAFWESKGFITPEKHRQYCGPIVPLVRMKTRSYAIDEPFTATAEVAQFAPKDLKGVRPRWTIKDQAGHELAGGELAAKDLPTGKLSPLGEINASLAKASAPCKLTVTLSLEGAAAENDWEIWVYPAQTSVPPAAGTVTATRWDAATKTALAEGKKVVLFPPAGNLAQSLPGRFLPVFWSPVWFPSQKPNTMGILCDPKHPAFAQFPTEFYSNWQWYDLLQHSRTLILDDTPATFRPIVQVIDNFSRNHKLGNLLEARVGKGRLLICTIDLPGLAAKQPAAAQLLRSLNAYVGSEAFDPKQELDEATLDKLFAPMIGGRMQKLGARVVRADSQHADYEAANVLDGNPATIWHTAWDDRAPGFPHELVIELAQPVAMTGCKLLPRQDMKNGWIKGYEIYTSDDGRAWGKPAAKGVFKQSGNLQTVSFGRTVKAKFIKLVALNSFEPKFPYASLAEFEVMEAGR